MLLARALAQVDLGEHEVAELRRGRRRPAATDRSRAARRSCAHQVGHQRVDPLARGSRPGPSSAAAGSSSGVQDPRADRVVDVVVQVGDPVGEPHDLRLQGRGRGHRPGVVQDAVADLPGEVQAGAVVLQELDDAQATARSGGTAGPRNGRERLLAQVPERRVAQVVPERDRLGEVLVQPERAGGRPGDLRDLERVGQAHPVVIALGREEHLRLVLQPAERLRVQDPVAVALEARAERVGGSSRSRPFDSARHAPRSGESVSRSICSVRSRGVVTRLMVAAPDRQGPRGLLPAQEDPVLEVGERLAKVALAPRRLADGGRGPGRRGVAFEPRSRAIAWSRALCQGSDTRNDRVQAARAQLARDRRRLSSVVWPSGTATREAWGSLSTPGSRRPASASVVRSPGWLDPTVGRGRRAPAPTGGGHDRAAPGTPVRGPRRTGPPRARRSRPPARGRRRRHGGRPARPRSRTTRGRRARAR